MAITINTNVASLNAQRNLGTSQSSLNKSMQRLSSGLRINSAKDDAAGLAISDRMTAQIRGLNQAARNSNDGISLAQTAEGALQESTNILQRMRELAVQSANDTNSASDRSSLNAEVGQLQAELDRIAETTEFNGRKLIDGSLEDATFQVGANAGTNQTISFNIDSALGKDLSQVGTNIEAPNGTTVSTTDVTAALAAGELTVNGNSIGATTDDAVSLATAISTADSDVTATATNVQTMEFSGATLAATEQVGTAVAGALGGGGDLTINGTDVGAAVQDAAAIATAIEAADSSVTATATNTATQTASPVSLGTTTIDGTAVTGAVAGGGDLTVNGRNVAATAQDAIAIAAAIETADSNVTATASGTTSVADTAAWTDVAADATALAQNTTVLSDAALGDININGTDVAAVGPGTTSHATDFKAVIETAADTAAGGVSDITVTVGASSSGDLSTFTDVTAGTTFTLNVNGDASNLLDVNAVTTLTDSEAFAAINAHGQTAGVLAVGGNDTITYTDDNGNDITITAGDVTSESTIMDSLTFSSAAGDDIILTESTGGAAEGFQTTVNNATDSSYGTLAIASASGEAIDLTGSADATAAGFQNTDNEAATDTSFVLTVGGIEVANVSAGITGAELDTLLADGGAAEIALTAAGIDVAGTAATDSLAFTRTDGGNLDIVQQIGADGNTEGLTSLSTDGSTDSYYGSIELTSTSDITMSGTVEANAGFTNDQAATVGTYNLSLDGTTVDLTNAKADGSISTAEYATAIDAISGYTATSDGDELTITKDDGSNIVLAETFADGQEGDGATAVTTTGTGLAEGTSYGSITLSSDVSFTVGGTSPGNAGLTAGTVNGGSYTLSVDDVAVDLTAATADAAVTATEIAAAIDGISGFTSSVNDAGAVEITKTDGSNFTITEGVDADGNGDDGAAAGLADASVTQSTHRGQVILDSAADIEFEGAALAAAGLDTVGNNTTTIDNISVDTRENAWVAIESVDAALADIDTIRGGLGAVQNRFESTIANLNNVSENLSAARSRILDADIATETSAMTKANILQQAGVSILAQANQAPQLALSLLG